jgi:hypothetical protein
MDFKYTIENNQVSITKYTGSSKYVTIPNEIEGLPVTIIRQNAFRWDPLYMDRPCAVSKNRLISIDLPQNLTTIESCAFRCNSLTSINFPQNLTTIGKSAFYENKLTSINLPQKLTDIDDHAFSFNNLTSISFPQNLTTIGKYAFGSNLLTSIDLPQNLATIELGVFYNNKLTSIILPNKFRTDEQITNIFIFRLEEFDNKNRKFIKPYLAKILEDCNVHHHFHDIIIDYTLPSNELIQEVIEA